MRSLVKRTLRQFGIEIRRYRAERVQAAQVVAMFSQHQVNLVFDVGANTGQFGRFLRDAGYRERIVSFAPLSEDRERLRDSTPYNLVGVKRSSP